MAVDGLYAENAGVILYLVNFAEMPTKWLDTWALNHNMSFLVPFCWRSLLICRVVHNNIGMVPLKVRYRIVYTLIPSTSNYHLKIM